MHFSYNKGYCNSDQQFPALQYYLLLLQAFWQGRRRNCCSIFLVLVIIIAPFIIIFDLYAAVEMYLCFVPSFILKLACVCMFFCLPGLLFWPLLLYFCDLQFFSLLTHTSLEGGFLSAIFTEFKACCCKKLRVEVTLLTSVPEQITKAKQ